MEENRISARPIKLLFVSNSCWSIYNFRIDILEYFIKAGYDVHVAASMDDFAILLINIGCKVYDIKFNNRKLNPVEEIQFYYTLKNLYSRIQPDLIFHYVIKPNIYGSMAASKLKIPSVAVITGLGYAFANKNWLTKLVIKLYKKALKNVSAVWMLNEQDRKFFIEKNIVAADKITVLQSEGINTERFVNAKRERKNHVFTFLMATRMLWSKGVGLFAEASTILRKKGYVFESQVIGFFEPNHPDTISLEQFEAWKNDKVFTALGFSENVIPFFENTDCFVLPSFYQEGVPRSLLEAGAMEVPSITTNNEGCMAVVQDGVNGFICKMNDIDDLVDKMEKILKLSSIELENMGTKARTLVVEKFHMHFVLEKYIQLLEKLNLKAR